MLIGAYLLLLGGIDAHGERRNNIGLLDLVTMTMYDVYEFTPYTRADINCVAIGTDVVLIGGTQELNSTVRRVNDGWLLHTVLDPADFDFFVPKPYIALHKRSANTKKNKLVQPEVVMDILYPLRMAGKKPVK